MLFSKRAELLPCFWGLWFNRSQGLSGTSSLSTTAGVIVVILIFAFSRIMMVNVVLAIVCCYQLAGPF